MGRNGNTIQQSVVIKGEVSATGDLTIEGHVDGKIELDHHVLTLGQNGRVEAQVRAKEVDVMGHLDGDIRATKTINIRATATVEGALQGIEDWHCRRGLLQRLNRHQHPAQEHNQAAETRKSTRAAPQAMGWKPAFGET